VVFAFGGMTAWRQPNRSLSGQLGPGLDAGVGAGFPPRAYTPAQGFRLRDMMAAVRFGPGFSRARNSAKIDHSARCGRVWLARVAAFLFVLAVARPAVAQNQPAEAHNESTEEGAPEANPARPTVSNPATLTPVGYLQFETGTLGATTSPEFSTRYEFNEVIKLAVSRRL